MGRNRRRRAQNKENKDRKIQEDTKEIQTNGKTNADGKLGDKEDQILPLLSNIKTVDTSDDTTVPASLENRASQNVSQLVETSPELSFINPGTERGSNSVPKHRDYYLHYLCQVCKIIPKPSQKVYCSKCKLVTYCSTEHKQSHWPSHSDICQALAELFMISDFKNISPEDFRKVRVDIIEKCEKIIQRPLEKSEKEMILYFNRCFQCYEREEKLIQSCNTCKHVSFCKNHTIHKDHSKHCPSLVVYRDIVLHITGGDLVSIYFPDTFAKQFEESNMSSICSKETDSELESAFLSELATSPLTVLQALKISFGSYEKIPRKLCIHVIGAENDFELSAIEKWEIFLAHYLSCTEIVLVFVGPELTYQGPTQSISCEECEAFGKNITVQFHPKSLYHDYVQGPHYLKPDLICSFNPGLYRSTGFNEKDTWEETIKQILQQTVPVLITAYTEVENFKDIQRIQQMSILNFLQPPRLNPFSSLKPFLSFVSDEVSPVFFKNHYHTIFSQILK